MAVRGKVWDVLVYGNGVPHRLFPLALRRLQPSVRPLVVTTPNSPIHASHVVLPNTAQVLTRLGLWKRFEGRVLPLESHWYNDADEKSTARQHRVKDVLAGGSLAVTSGNAVHTVLKKLLDRDFGVAQHDGDELTRPPRRLADGTIECQFRGRGRVLTRHLVVTTGTDEHANAALQFDPRVTEQSVDAEFIICEPVENPGYQVFRQHPHDSLTIWDENGNGSVTLRHLPRGRLAVHCTSPRFPTLFGPYLDRPDGAPLAAFVNFSAWQHELWLAVSAMISPNLHAQKRSEVISASWHVTRSWHGHRKDGSGRVPNVWAIGPASHGVISSPLDLAFNTGVVDAFEAAEVWTPNGLPVEHEVVAQRRAVDVAAMINKQTRLGRDQKTWWNFLDLRNKLPYDRDLGKSHDLLNKRMEAKPLPQPQQQQQQQLQQKSS